MASAIAMKPALKDWYQNPDVMAKRIDDTFPTQKINPNGKSPWGQPTAWNRVGLTPQVRDQLFKAEAEARIEYFEKEKQQGTRRSEQRQKDYEAEFGK